MRFRRGRRRAHNVRYRRQSGLLLQPGSGFQLGGSEQEPSASPQNSNPQLPMEIPGSQSPAGSAESSASVSSTIQPSVEPQSQSQSTSQKQAVPSSSSRNELSESTILFAPSVITESLAVSLVISASGSNAVSPSLVSSPSSSSQIQIASSQSVASVSATVSYSSASTLSQTTTSSSASNTVSSIPANDVSPTSASHGTQFYVGLVFLIIAVVACLVSFIAWLFRSQLRRPSWCCGDKEDDDLENQDLGFGLGLFLDKPFRESFPSGMMSLSHEKTEMGETTVLPPLPSAPNSPFRTVRPPPAHLRSTDSVDIPNHSLGHLELRNFMPGDFSSSCDEAAVQRPRRSDSYGDLGTPREACPGGTPRFMTLGGQGLSVPWSPMNVKSVDSVKQASLGHSPSHRSVVAEAGNVLESWDGFSPLPLPRFSTNNACGEQKVVGAVDTGPTDGWGATLRYSIMSALSAVTGGHGSSKVQEDRFTPFPSRMSTNARRDGHMGSFAPIVSETVSKVPHPPDTDTIAKQSYQEQEFGDITPLASTTPLILHKKLTSVPTYQTMAPLDVKLSSISRASSVYSPMDTLTRLPDRPLSTKMKKYGDTSNKTRSSLSQAHRPIFLKRGTSSGGSVTSFSSESSEASKELTDGERLAKQMMMLRVRRKKAVMDRKISTSVARRGSASRNASRRRSTLIPDKL